ncbi:sigma-70 family RNA polymerase sigma factor [Haloferula sp. A504]|uniref:sigma-70 family RNA polymerase sigma factor n=1 Tax=Haloferula sp. A504 TaxID=3373601 RepID=UPI0031CA017A|nr:sigma-70 family RNA polymerase sigma factor [Verrucomicrobiaceae bacterium E54]
MIGRKSGDGSQQLQEFVSELTANQGRIRAFLVSLMPGSPDVGDVLQETNIVLWKSRTRYQPGTNFLAWAFTIARLEVLHHRTRAKRQRIVFLSDEVLELMAEEVPDDVDHEAYLRALEGCKAKLSDTQRELIDLRYRPGFTLEAHARETGRKPSTLRVALMRIRDSLRECVENKMKEHPA